MLGTENVSINKLVQHLGLFSYTYEYFAFQSLLLLFVAFTKALQRKVM